MKHNYGNATFEEILGYAKAHLARWKPRLSAECYAALEAHAEREWSNADRALPYEVFRGDAMTEFVQNWKPTP